MSAIVAVVRLDGAPVAEEGARSAMAALAHRGPDGADLCTLQDGTVALGHLHFRTTPEEAGERQPVAADRVVVAFDGRIDNRVELRSELATAQWVDTMGEVGAAGEATVRLAGGPGDAVGAAREIDTMRARSPSDAELVLAAYRRWGLDCLEHLLGPFALAVHDGRSRRLLLARDPLGSRTLAYHVGRRAFVAASEPAAVAAHPDVGADLDDAALACLLALRAPDPTRSLFAKVRLLPAGHALCLEGDRARSWRFWRPSVQRVRGLSDAAYAERFHEVLYRSVARRMRAVGPTAVQMSGGLDSTSVAALAADAAKVRGEAVRTFSYVFDSLPVCDERSYIAAMVHRHGVISELLPGDDAHPLERLSVWPFDPNGPTPPHSLLVDRVQAAAEREGVRVLLSGYGGDQIYGGLQDWLADLLAEGRVREGLGELATHVRRSGLRKVAGSQTVRCVARRALARGRLLRAAAPAAEPAPPWLTESGRALAAEAIASNCPGDIGPVGPAPWPDVVAGVSWFGMPAAYRPYRPGIEVRCPFRDRDLVAFMAETPAHQRYNRGAAKHVLRGAMRGRLPEAIRTRTAPTSLVPFFRQGLAVHAATARRMLDAPDAAWRRFVRPDALGEPGGDPGGAPDRELLVWTCLSLDLWLRHRSALRAPSPVVGGRGGR